MAQVRMHMELVVKAVLRDFEVQLAHAAQHRLRRGARTALTHMQTRISPHKHAQRVRHGPLIRLAAWLHADTKHGRRHMHATQAQRVPRMRWNVRRRTAAALASVDEGIASTGVLEA